jgi:CheY-like chemotaxis protein
MEKKILIVDDYKDARHFMKFLLEGYGYRVSEAVDGFEAVEKTKQEQPDLIIMDISMPVLDGLAATRLIRESEIGNKVPIIAVTGFGQNYYQQSLEAGCSKLINKPVNFDELFSLIEHYLEPVLNH